MERDEYRDLAVRDEAELAGGSDRSDVLGALRRRFDADRADGAVRAEPGAGN